MILRGQVATQDQTITALRAQFFDSLKQFAPSAWHGLCTLKDAYKRMSVFQDWITWVGFSYILEPPNGNYPHWRDAPWVLSNPIEMDRHMRQFELFNGLQEWRQKYLIQETWVLDYALEWLRHISTYPDRGNDKPSRTVGLKFFEMPIDPQPPKLPTYDAAWASRKEYLKEAIALLERYCDEVEREALNEGMEFTKANHPRALEWLVKYQFNFNSHSEISNRDVSTVRRAIEQISETLGFTYRGAGTRGRPRKTI